MTEPSPGLTTTRAPFVERARGRGDLFIDQPYDEYSEKNHATWRRLYGRLRPRWERYAHPRFQEGLERLALDPCAVPRLEDVNTFLAPLSGFVARPVSGYVPAFLFFDCLRRREFPTTITIRDASSLDYLPEPDIFHDLAGHVPMHTDPRFADTLVRFGEVARTAARLAGEKDSGVGPAELESIVKALARFFWFTIEFGLMRCGSGLRVYGSGLLSSYEEIRAAVESPHVQRRPFRLEWVVDQAFEIDHAQPLLFVMDGFDRLFEEVDRLEQYMLRGRLSHVAPGEPSIGAADLASFVDPATISRTASPAA